MKSLAKRALPRAGPLPCARAMRALIVAALALAASAFDGVLPPEPTGDAAFTLCRVDNLRHHDCCHAEATFPVSYCSLYIQAVSVERRDTARREDRYVPYGEWVNFSFHAWNSSISSISLGTLAGYSASGEPQYLPGNVVMTNPSLDYPSGEWNGPVHYWRDHCNDNDGEYPGAGVLLYTTPESLVHCARWG